MILRRVADHVIHPSPTCGEVREILRGADFSPNVAIALDLTHTTAHYHRTFDEIYFVLDGSLTLRLHDPATGATTTEKLSANELAVITRGIHHQVIDATPGNRLCVITTPRYDAADEVISDRL